MKARITIVALVFLLLGVANANAQKHYYKGKKMHARHGYHHKGHPGHYGGHKYHRYRNVRYAKPVRHYYYPTRYSRRAVYANPYPGRYYSRPVYNRPIIQASIFLP
ncbi:MAG TPA: hypothetical protein VL943_01280 [Niabella sp.]|nr:hypothetical protein [Niabella sp.]